MTSIAGTSDRSLRSVFVGNIPYDATEEKLKDIFSEVGPVVSFKLVYDRETGKPKGYGFCEYKDQDTAMSAMRNLNQYELNGRNLRVDNATNERLKEEMRSLQLSLSGAAFESPYGPEVDPEKAPEAISKAVASLPPEQMFELAKQMKQCIQTNPSEARNMLVQNPQLAYALLQALVVMRVVEPTAAMQMLHRPGPTPAPLMPLANTNLGVPQPQTQPPIFEPNFGGQRPFGQQIPPQQPFDGRMHERHDPRLRDGPPFERFPQQTGPIGPMGPIQGQNVDPRTRPVDPRIQASQQMPPNARGGPPPSANQLRDQVRNQPFGGQHLQLPSNFQSGPLNPNQEQEKANLIMQVLALSDAQIALLPAEQRQSIMLLKEQIQRGSS